MAIRKGLLPFHRRFSGGKSILFRLSAADLIFMTLHIGRRDQRRVSRKFDGHRRRFY